MIILYILCAAIICVVGYAFVWVAAGVLMSIFSKKLPFQDDMDETNSGSRPNGIPEEDETISETHTP